MMPTDFSLERPNAENADANVIAKAGEYDLCSNSLESDPSAPTWTVGHAQAAGVGLVRRVAPIAPVGKAKEVWTRREASVEQYIAV